MFRSKQVLRPQLLQYYTTLLVILRYWFIIYTPNLHFRQ